MSTDQESAQLPGPSTVSGNGKKLLERAWDAWMAEGFAEGLARRYVEWMRDYVPGERTDAVADWRPRRSSSASVGG